MGVLDLMLYGLIRGIRGLKGERALKKLYVQANDERMQMVMPAACSSAMQITLLGGPVISCFHMAIGLIISWAILQK